MGEEPFQQSWLSGCNPWAEDYTFIYFLEVFYSIAKNCPKLCTYLIFVTKATRILV